MAANIETMAYAKAAGAPWHGLGTVVEGATDSDVMMKAAGLDWEVELEDIFLGNGRQVPGRKAVVRDTDGKILGDVSDTYTVLQNKAIFDWTDGLLLDGRIQYRTAGSLRGGALVWALAEVPGEVEIAGDIHKTFVLISGGHDGGHAVTIAPTDVTVVCNNTLNMALAGAKGEPGFFRFLHTSGLTDKMAAAQQVLAMTTESQRRMATMLEKLALTPVTQDDFLRLEETLFGPKDDRGPRVASKVKGFRSIVRADVARRGTNAYALLQGVTGFAAHGRMLAPTTTKKSEQRFESIMFGGGAEGFTAKGVAFLRELATV